MNLGSAPVEERAEPGRAGPLGRWAAGLRASVAAGLVVVLPLGLTIWLMWAFAGWVDRAVMPLIPGWLTPGRYVGLDPRGFGIVVFLAVTVAVGWFAKGWAGRTAIRMTEALVARTPIVRPIYRGVKQMAEAIVVQSDTAFDRVCLVEYPRRGCWSVALVVIPTKGELAGAARGYRDTVEVLIPRTPNPLTGYLILVPKREIVELDLSLEDGLKLIVSGGIAQAPVPRGP